MQNQHATKLVKDQLDFTLSVAGMVALVNVSPLGPFQAPGLWELCGYEPSDAPMELADIRARTHPDDVVESEQSFEDLLGRRGEFRETVAKEMRIVLPNGRLRYIQINGIRLWDGSDIRYFLVLQDVTRLRESEVLLKQRSEELAVCVEKLKQFSAIVAHDLKNPLSSIVMAASLLKHAESLSETAAYGEAIEGASTRAIHLINDLLAFAKLYNDNDVPKEDVDLQQVLPAVVADLQAALQQSGGQVTVPTELPVVHGHRFQLKQLFQNLIANALKFRSGRPPSVTIAVAEEPQHWRFAVRDNGIGIEPSKVSRLFEPFRRLHAGYEGTGLGLSICKKITDLHGGAITVESQVGVGTEFVVTLPKA